MARATKKAAPMAEPPHARSTLNRQRSSGSTLTAHQHHRRLACSSARLYSPGGCGCALLMAPVMAAAMGLAALSLGMAALAVGGLAVAVALTVREVRRARGGAGIRPGFAVAAGALYLASVPYLVFFIWLWFVD